MREASDKIYINTLSISLEEIAQTKKAFILWQLFRHAQRIHKKCKKKSWRNFVCILMWILFKETSSTCMIFLQSLQQHINHIPRWWARIFSAYKMISCSLFETFYSLFLMVNNFFSLLLKFIRKTQNRTDYDFGIRKHIMYYAVN